LVAVPLEASLFDHKDAKMKQCTEANPSKCGWRVGEWSDAIGCSRSFTYLLIAAKEIDSVKLGAARVITTAPQDFLAKKGGEAA
jgi:hypothetical protein